MVLWNGGTSVWARGSTVTSLLGCSVTIPSAFATECGLVTTGTSCHSISWYSSCLFSVASSKLFWAIFCRSCHPLEALKKWLHADDVLNIRFPSPVADITSWFIGVVFLKTLKGSNQKEGAFQIQPLFWMACTLILNILAGRIPSDDVSRISLSVGFSLLPF